jgi:hypothetical protein
MAASSQQKRIIRVPASAGRVNSEVLNQLNTLKVAGTALFITQSTNLLNLAQSQPLINQYEAILSSANDTTLQSFFAGWATLLDVATLDTEVATFSAGN